MVTSRTSVSKHVAESFRRFFNKLPKSGDKELTVLKGHLLVEEQIRRLISNRLYNPEAFIKARLRFQQCVYLAQALFPPKENDWVWSAALRLNEIRNDIAHKIEPVQLAKKIDNFIAAHPSSYQDIGDEEDKFSFVLWSLFTALSLLVEKPSPHLLELVSDKKVVHSVL